MEVVIEMRKTGNMFRNLLLGIMFAFYISCTDAQCAGVGAFGTAGHIVCYSGGKVIYEGDSTGKIETETHSDGWNFKDAKTGKFIRVSGQCLITN